MLKKLLLCWLIASCNTPQVHAVGIYGVSGNPPELNNYAITRVWGPAKQEWITSQVEQGREVFLTLNAFGGSAAWQQFPDSRPVLANGKQLEGKYGGVCPSHRTWRQARLALLQKWLEDFTGEKGISGIWLDFIRYPGQWETGSLAVPKTCYCRRCLNAFQQETKTVIPEQLHSTADKAHWIDTYAAEKWHSWKKEQILSFVRHVRTLLDSHNDKLSTSSAKIKLGVFLVPWRKSDFNGAISSFLAQDAELLAPYVDVFSPMIYHKMVQQPPSWAGEITRYFKNIGEQAGIATWPIIQSENVSPEEFGKLIKETESNGAQEIIVYSLQHMQHDQWPFLQKFSPEQNLLPTSSIEREEVTAPLPRCKPGNDYLFSAEFLRQDRNNPNAYPEISLWGKRYRLDTHRTAGKYQRIKAIVTCPPSFHEQEGQFRFVNRYPDTPFLLRSPSLHSCTHKNCRTTPPAKPAPLSFFPLGVYGANAKNLKEIQNLGCNTAVVGLNRDTVEQCLKQDMRCTFSVPHQPEKLLAILDEYDELLKQGNFLFYVNDEPALRSAPEWKAEDVQRILKHRFPQNPTMMAVVRPQTVPLYEGAADYFMMDQYPVPSMPVTWLADSLDNTAEAVGKHRMMSVVQAFGGKDFAAHGWPRYPTFTEMYNLAMLSVIHGSRGIFFYTFPSIVKTEQGKSDFLRVMRRLNSLRAWFSEKNDAPVTVTMTSHYNTAPDGKKAVRCISKKRHMTRMFLCANVLPYNVRADISAKGERPFTEYFTGERYTPGADRLDLDFAGLEVKVLMEEATF